jgi:hypothetical protein
MKNQDLLDNLQGHATLAAAKAERASLEENYPETSFRIRRLDDGSLEVVRIPSLSDGRL